MSSTGPPCGSLDATEKHWAYLLEWVNPKPEVAVESIDFIGADTGEPLLLAVTAAVRK